MVNPTSEEIALRPDWRALAYLTFCKTYTIN